MIILINDYFYIISQQIRVMYQTGSQNSIKDNISENAHTIELPFSLPLIPDKPKSRCEVSPNKSGSSKNNTLLPKIKKKQPRTSLKKISQEALIKDKKFRNTFTRQIEEELSRVLKNKRPNGQQITDEKNQTEDFDFEALVNKNRELIKHYKKNKIGKSIAHISTQKQEHSLNLQKNQNSRKQLSPDKKSLGKNKKSIQNKYYPTRKPTFKQYQKSKQLQVKKSLKQQKFQNYHSNSLKNALERPNNNQIFNKKVSSKKPAQTESKSISLFNGIHQFLQNPKRNVEKQPFVGLSLLKAKRDIEDKIKAIDLKIENDNTQITSKQSIGSVKTNEAINKQFNHHQLVFHDRQFDNEVSRIQSLEEKNNLSIQKYIEYKKQLIQVVQQQQALRVYKKSTSSS